MERILPSFAINLDQNIRSVLTQMKIIYIKNCSKIRYYYFRAQINKRISIKFAICAVQSTSTSAQLIMKSFLFDFTDKALPEET